MTLTSVPVRTTITLIAAATIAASCSSSTGKAHVAATNGHPDPAAIASKIGCDGYAADTSGTSEIYTATAGDCTYQGQSVTIVTFASSDSFSKWRTAAKAAVGGDGTTALGDRYAIEAPNADVASSIAAAIGGTTQ